MDCINPIDFKDRRLGESTGNIADRHTWAQVSIMHDAEVGHDTFDLSECDIRRGSLCRGQRQNLQTVQNGGLSVLLIAGRLPSFDTRGPRREGLTYPPTAMSC